MDKNNIATLRDIPLTLVLEKMGAEPDPADPRRNWHHPAGRITVTDTRYYNHTQQKGGGGAIDLTMHLGEFTFPQAISFLAQEVGRAEIIAEAKRRVEEAAKKPAPKIGIPPKDEAKIQQVFDYLTKRRGIPSKIVHENIAQGNLWADKYGNCVFAMRDSGGNIVGAEIRGTYDTPFHGTRGEKDRAFFYAGNTSSKKAAFVESAIDALSYQALHPDTLAISSNGTRRDYVVETSKKLFEKGYQVFQGQDADKPGDALAKNIIADLSGQSNRHRPAIGKDWNDQLRATLEHAQTQKKSTQIQHQER